MDGESSRCCTNAASAAADAIYGGGGFIRRRRLRQAGWSSSKLKANTDKRAANRSRRDLAVMRVLIGLVEGVTHVALSRQDRIR